LILHAGDNSRINEEKFNPQRHLLCGQVGLLGSGADPGGRGHGGANAAGRNGAPLFQIARAALFAHLEALFGNIRSK